ncbi:MAG: CsgG/HfaB family protein [Verrucomicrobia bacterium]|nr:CsgG/HfaB family protein [Verrucomicrobiota bacterium]
MNRQSAIWVGTALVCLLVGCATTSGATRSTPQNALKAGVDDLVGGITPKVASARRTSVAIVGFSPVMGAKPKSDAFSQYLVEELTTRLVTDGKVTLAERSQLDKVMNELKLQSSGTLDLRKAVGKPGEIYLTVPAGGTGKIQVTVQNHMSIFDAVSLDGTEISTGTAVRVAELRGANVMVVERI